MGISGGNGLMSEHPKRDEEGGEAEEVWIRDPEPVWTDELQERDRTLFFGGEGRPAVERAMGLLMGIVYVVVGISFFAWERSFVTNFFGVSAISFGARQLWVAGWRKKK